MDGSGVFLLNSVFLGAGLAVDAFSLAVVNGFSEPGLHPLKAARIASVFAFFQALMPMLGWTLTHLMLHCFAGLQRLIPFVSLGILGYLGLKMICGHYRREEQAQGLLLQGVATSLDALSAGFAIAEYSFHAAFPCSLIIAAVTFVLCSMGVMLGKRIGCRIAKRAELLGGLVLIGIGLEIFLHNLL